VLHVKDKERYEPPPGKNGDDYSGFLAFHMIADLGGVAPEPATPAVVHI
jgi:hypothetical protein